MFKEVFLCVKNDENQCDRRLPWHPGHVRIRFYGPEQDPAVQPAQRDRQPLPVHVDFLQHPSPDHPGRKSY